MPNATIAVSFNRPKNYVLTRFTGHLDYDGILSSFELVVYSSSYRPGMARLWDLTEADLSSLSEESIWIASHYSTVFPPGVNNVKVALFSENQEHMKLLHLFKSSSSDTKSRVEVFESFQEAEDWITGKV